MAKLVDIRSARDRVATDASISDLEYAKAFQEAGIDVAALRPADVGAKIKAQPAPVAVALVAALDDWAIVRRSRRSESKSQFLSRDAQRLADAANAADPDPWRVSLRRALDPPHQAQVQAELGGLNLALGVLCAIAAAERASRELRDLAASTKLESAEAVHLDLLGKALSELGQPKAAEEILRAGQRRFPGDVWLNYDLAQVLDAQSRGAEAIRYYSIARACDPRRRTDWPI